MSVEIERIAAEQARVVAGELLRIAKRGGTEADFRREAARVLEEAGSRAGLTIVPRDEFSVARGRVDSVYNRLVLEYKRPGVIRESNEGQSNQEVIRQVKQYVLDVAKRERREAQRLAGVATDGFYFIFVRRVGEGWSVDDPAPVNPASSERFLRLLYSLSAGAALVPENLVEDFGPRTLRAQRAVRALYTALHTSKHPLVLKLFEQWRLFFSEATDYKEWSERIESKEEFRGFVKGMGLDPRYAEAPIHVAQVGAAAVFRKDDGQVSVGKSVHRIVLMLDKKAVSFGDKVEDLVRKAGPRFGFHDTMEEDGETEKSSPGKEPRSRAAHKAHHIMAGEEEKLGRELQRGKDQWLVLDGSLGKDLHSWKDVPQFFGVTKSFSREPLFKLPGARGGQVINLYELLSNLPFSARTCAFSARSGKVVVWYVRLREQRHLDYPLMGVVKVEFPNPTGEAVPSDLIDEISSAIVAERQVTPHGKDIRWHAHIYAIYLAEQAVKTGFVSSEALKAGIRWPTQTVPKP